MNSGLNDLELFKKVTSLVGTLVWGGMNDEQAKQYAIKYYGLTPQVIEVYDDFAQDTFKRLEKNK